MQLLSKRPDILQGILSLVGKHVPIKELKKASKEDLVDAEQWAVRRNAFRQGIKVKQASVPKWLWPY